MANTKASRAARRRAELAGLEIDRLAREVDDMCGWAALHPLMTAEELRHKIDQEHPGDRTLSEVSWLAWRAVSDAQQARRDIERLTRSLRRSLDEIDQRSESDWLPSFFGAEAAELAGTDARLSSRARAAGELFKALGAWPAELTSAKRAQDLRCKAASGIRHDGTGWRAVYNGEVVGEEQELEWLGQPVGERPQVAWVLVGLVGGWLRAGREEVRRLLETEQEVAL